MDERICSCTTFIVCTLQQCPNTRLFDNETIERNYSNEILRFNLDSRPNVPNSKVWLSNNHWSDINQKKSFYYCICCRICVQNNDDVNDHKRNTQTVYAEMGHTKIIIVEKEEERGIEKFKIENEIEMEFMDNSIKTCK